MQYPITKIPLIAAPIPQTVRPPKALLSIFVSFFIDEDEEVRLPFKSYIVKNYIILFVFSW